MKTIQQAFREAVCLLKLKRLPQAALDARLLLQKVESLSEEQFFASPNKLLSPKEERLYERLISRRLARFPLSYLTGMREFWSMPFQVKPGVLIPRPETELIVEKVLELCAKKDPLIMDVGTGCGNIAIALAKEMPAAKIWAMDISPKALRFAKQNADQLGASNITFVRSNLFDPSEISARPKQGKLKQFPIFFDFIVSNPPYVSESEWPKLIPEIRTYEPKRALVAGKTGLEFIGRLIRESIIFLKPGGWLIFEIGQGQLKQVLGIFREYQNSALNSGETSLNFPEISYVSPELPELRRLGMKIPSYKKAQWTDVSFVKDLAGMPRIITARRA